MEQEPLKEFLRRKFEAKKSEFPRYSLRMFAEKIGVHPAALSLYFNGKRSFSAKLAQRIGEQLGLSPKEIKALTSSEKNKTQTAEDALDSQMYFLLSDPLYFSLLSLMQTQDFKDDVDWISSQLMRTKRDVQKAIKVLIELKFIERAKEGLKVLKLSASTTDNIPNYFLRVRHQKNMEDARQALEKWGVDRRYFAFETLPFDKEDLPLVQKKINDLLDDLILLSERARKKDCVYEFINAYFPRTK